MDANALDHALAESLSLIESGQATVADCLERYPHLSKLGPLLNLALDVRQLPHPEPDPDWFAASRQRLEDALRPKPEPMLSVAGPAAAVVLAWRWSWESSAASTPQLFALRVAAVFSMLLLLGGNAVTAAEASLPGSPLYSFKLAAEEARVAATFDPVNRAALHLQIAEQRLTELAQANAAGAAASTAALALAAQAELQAALADAERAVPGRRTPFASRVQSLTKRAVSFSGTATTAAPDALTVQGVTVQLTPETVITGNLAAGSRVSVRGSLGADGHYQAVAVTVTESSQPGGYRSAAPSYHGLPFDRPDSDAAYSTVSYGYADPNPAVMVPGVG